MLLNITYHMLEVIDYDDDWQIHHWRYKAPSCDVKYVHSLSRKFFELYCQNGVSRGKLEQFNLFFSSFIFFVLLFYFFHRHAVTIVHYIMPCCTCSLLVRHILDTWLEQTMMMWVWYDRILRHSSDSFLLCFVLWTSAWHNQNHFRLVINIVT